MRHDVVFQPGERVRHKLRGWIGRVEAVEADGTVRVRITSGGYGLSSGPAYRLTRIDADAGAAA